MRVCTSYLQAMGAKRNSFRSVRAAFDRRCQTAPDLLEAAGATTDTINAFAKEIRRLGFSPQDIINLVDVDDNGELDLEEFSGLIGELKLDIKPDQIQSMFAALDADSSGTIDKDELRKALSQSEKAALTKAIAQKKQGSTSTVGSTPFLVALVANNNMKASMMEFVADHLDFFHSVGVVTTGSTGLSLEGKLGLKTAFQVSSGPLGGDQEIGAYIAQHKIAAVIFFRDPLSAHAHDADIGALGRLCDVHNVMVATNPASALCVVEYLKQRPEMLSGEKQHKDSAAVAAYKQQQAAVMSKVVGTDFI